MFCKAIRGLLVPQITIGLKWACLVVALGAMVIGAPQGAAAAWVNLYSEYEPGKPYAQCQGISGDWDNWSFHWQVSVPSDSPYSILGAQSFPIDVIIDDQAVSYEGNGVWQIGNSTATFVGASGYQKLDPSWNYLYTSSQNWNLEYPYVDMGDLHPGDVTDYWYHWDWVDQPAWSTAAIAGDDFGQTVPEPSAIALLAIGAASLFAWRRRRQAA